MAYRRQIGPSCGGGRSRPEYNQQAGSLRPITYGSGQRNNGWNGRGNTNPRQSNQNNNRTHNFLPHQPVHYGAPSPVQPQAIFRQGYHRRQTNPRFQNQQGGGFNAPKYVHQNPQFQRNTSSENPVPFPTGFEDHQSAPFPKNRRRRNRRNQTTAFNAYSPYNAVNDIDMADASSHHDTDIDMPDAPPLECYHIDNWINEPTLLVAEGLASANEMLSRIEYFVRTGTMPLANVNFHC